MSHQIQRLVDVLPLEPEKEVLRKIMHMVCALLLIQGIDLARIEIAFELSFEGHRLAPRRASGEIYFLHPFRQFVRAALLMDYYQVVHVDLLVLILLHDTVEDAEKGRSLPYIEEHKIRTNLGDEMAFSVMNTTKKKHLEELRSVFLERIIASPLWWVLVAKLFDLEDNTITLSALRHDKQLGKVVEVFGYSMRIVERALHLIETEGEKGNLEYSDRWAELTKAIHRSLMRHAHVEYKRIQVLSRSDQMP